ncbi:hypothetical protein [Chromobacterium sphagni]|nr:hypothetical protein [Chromobacterium sphagni]
MDLPHHEKGRQFNKKSIFGAAEIPCKFNNSAHFSAYPRQHGKPSG